MTPWKKTQTLSIGIVTLLMFLPWQTTFAGPLRERISGGGATNERSEPFEDEAASGEPASLPAHIRIVRDVPYGSDKLQRFDVYSPREAKNAPVIFMVQGGAWFLGDKASRAVVENKVARWAPRGFVIVSTNYRLLPKADPLEQARDVARALATAQDKAATWGGDRTRFILMGHSAGAHLVALLDANPSIATGIVTIPWLGAVSLDSAALDVVKIMEAGHARFYDRAFGRDPAYWRAASPFHAATGAGKPILVVCSTRRGDSCSQAGQFVSKASSLGVKARVLEENFSHKDLNQRLGEEGGYTDAVEQFLAGLDESIALMLKKK